MKIHNYRPLGAHTSTAGGLPKAVERALALDATALQIFTRNQVQWKSPPLDDEIAEAFRSSVAASQLRFVCAHSSYLINLASPDTGTRRKSFDALLEETRRSAKLDCFCLVLHPGSPKDESVETGLERVADGLKQVLDETSDLDVRIALENTAGQGNSLGASIEQLGEIAARVGRPQRIGMCLDSAHAHAAGYDFESPAAIDELIEQIGCNFGLDRLYLMHLNDSRSERGSRVDRHAGIGQGSIGDNGFRNLLAHTAIKTIPGIIETPKGDDAVTNDRRNLARLRELEKN